MSAHRDYSNWDRWIWTKRRVSKENREPGESGNRARLRTRIEVVARALDGGQAELESLSAELWARRNYWRVRFAPHGNPEKLAHYARSSPNRMALRMSLIWLPFAGILAAMVFGPLLYGSTATLPVAVFFIMPVLMPPIMFAMRPLFRLAHCLVHSECPDCEYPLEDLPDAIKLPQGDRTGPDRCPECGAPWPLVPPPAIR